MDPTTDVEKRNFLKVLAGASMFSISGNLLGNIAKPSIVSQIPIHHPNPTLTTPVAWHSIEGKPYITVSGNGIANGGSSIVNGGADFGVDTVGTTSDGLGEALQFAIDNPTLNGRQTEVHILSADIVITAPIVLNVPAGKLGSMMVTGVGGISPYIQCKFNSVATDAYPYAININSADYGNISFINLQFEKLVFVTVGGYTPYGALNMDFTGQSTIHSNTFVGYDINIGNNGFVKALNLIGFQQIYMYEFENYGSNSYFNAGNIQFIGGNYGIDIYVSGGDCYSTGTAIPFGSMNNLIIGSGTVIIGEVATQTFTINNIIVVNLKAFPSQNGSGIYFNNNGGTITVNSITVLGGSSDTVLTGNQFLVMQRSCGNYVVNNWNIGSLTSGNAYNWTVIPRNSPSLSVNPPVSGAVYQNPYPYTIIYLPVRYAASVASTLTPYLGPTNTATALPAESELSAITGAVTRTYILSVPAFLYYEFVLTGTGSSLGTAGVLAD